MQLQEIIEEAYEQIGVRPDGGYDLRTARRSLALVLQRWQNRQFNNWQMQEYLLQLEAGKAMYPLPSDAIDLKLASIRKGQTGPDLDLGERWNFEDYHVMSNKSQAGRPVNFLVHKQSDRPCLYLWPVPDSNEYVLTGYIIKADSVKTEDGAMRPYDFTVQIPARFEPVLVAELAAELALKRAQLPLHQQLSVRAMNMWLEAERGDSSGAPLYIRPDLSGR